MSLQRRYLEAYIREDLDRRMVFVGGPRQVGKTTLARLVGEDFAATTYRNWDHRPHRQALLDGHWPPGVDLLILDEIHKWPRWKGLVKGLWDTRPSGERIIVTGSSRLDIFRRGGDSLLGRYRYYRLHPFSLAELNDLGAAATPFPTAPPTLHLDRDGRHLETLLAFGGFPEPCLSGRERTLRRWQKERFERVFREDIRETEAVRSLAQVELLGSLLPGRVGSPLPISSLAEDVEASPKTVRSWIELLARNYYLFRVPPWHRRLDRALRKESKYYLWDWSEVKEEGPRFENMVAAHLLKLCHYYEDTHGIGAALYYVRDQQKREVDFLVVWEGEPWFLVECKAGAPGGFGHLRYLRRQAGGRAALLRHTVRSARLPGSQHRRPGGAGPPVPHGAGVRGGGPEWGSPARQRTLTATSLRQPSRPTAPARAEPTLPEGPGPDGRSQPLRAGVADPGCGTAEPTPSPVAPSFMPPSTSLGHAPGASQSRGVRKEVYASLPLAISDSTSFFETNPLVAPPKAPPQRPPGKTEANP